MDPLPVGTQAPEFEALDQDGRTVRLGDARGRFAVLWFYPEDDTPGCAAEACAFRDAEDALQREGLVVWGMSTDDAASHQRFARKYGLPFPLLADPDGRIAEAYGVLRDDGTAGRATYILGPDGRVEAVFPKVDPTTHAAEVLEAARRIRQAQAPRR